MGVGPRMARPFGEVGLQQSAGRGMVRTLPAVDVIRDEKCFECRFSVLLFRPLTSRGLFSIAELARTLWGCHSLAGSALCI